MTQTRRTPRDRSRRVPYLLVMAFLVIAALHPPWPASAGSDQHNSAVRGRSTVTSA